MGRMQGRKAIVAGGAGAICQAIAAAFVAEGASVAILDRDEAGARRAANNSLPINPNILDRDEAGARRAAGTIGATGFGCDVPDEVAVAEAVAVATEALGGCDALLNGAAMLEMKPFSETSLADRRRIQDINLTGPFLVTRAALPALRAAGKAAIVNIASMNAFKPAPWSAAHSGAKAGVVMLTKSLAMELSPDIRVNAICPGAMRSAMSAPHLSDPAIEKRAKNATALRMVGEPEHVAAAAVHLMSHEAAFTTGTWLMVDGGNCWY